MRNQSECGGAAEFKEYAAGVGPLDPTSGACVEKDLPQTVREADGGELQGELSQAVQLRHGFGGKGDRMFVRRTEPPSRLA
ncbi:MAG: hypothetical protein ACLQIB_37225 [Isosphaeraceae bacterium]